MADEGPQVPSGSTTIHASESPASRDPSRYELGPASSGNTGNGYAVHVSPPTLATTSALRPSVPESPSRANDATEPVVLEVPHATSSAIGTRSVQGIGQLQSNGPGLSAAYPIFRPVCPEKFRRYDREDTVPKKLTIYELPSMMIDFADNDDPLPSEWEEFVHLEGARYFMHRPKKLYTDANIYDPDILSLVTRLIKHYEQYIRDHSIRLPEHVNIVFDLHLDKQHKLDRCEYYLVNHAARVVFWLDKFELNDSTLHVWSEIQGVSKFSHVRHAIEAQYWQHCQFFPDSFTLQSAHADELRDILNHSIGDVLTSITTTVPYKVDELQHMLGMVNEIQKNAESSKCVSVYSKLMYLFARHRFCNFHGQPAARLDRDRSVYYGPSYKAPRTLFLRILSPLLFYAPSTYRRALDKLWVDGFLHATSWNDFINDMNTEWQQLILLGTVVLNANVAFLAIQSVDEDTPSPNKSPAQIASYLSVMASIGSIIIGLMLTRKNKANSKEAVEGSAIFLNSFAKHRRGLEPLAVLYSVPYAFLMWGVILFLLGFSIMCLQRSTITIKLLLGGAWVFTVFPIIWCTYILATLDKWLVEGNNFIVDEIARKTINFIKEKLIEFGLMTKKESPPPTRHAPRALTRMTFPVRKWAEVLRRAVRRAIIVTTLGRFGGAGSGQGSNDGPEGNDIALQSAPRSTV
ncbi:hypothetical protein VNI00_015390 [Paramarasmius palmivorus]|uniref:Uncharacterized protein n=1 Tax=Paramarasmius palmivorus TaxID=297713 RepID=A0AAW0BKY9_9AGAR